MLLIVGLGNPGPKYQTHRHNLGFMTLDRVQSRVGASEWRDKFGGHSGRGVIAGQEATLLKPQTFMNLSGRAVQKALAQLGAHPKDMIVVHDDLDLVYGDVRVKVGGGHGGHNGLRDISAAIGPEYIRVRIGIGRPSVGTVEHYVLSPFSKEELASLDGILERAADALVGLIADGPAPTMNKVNTRPKK